MVRADTPAAELAGRLAERPVDLAAISRLLDGLGSDERVSAVRSLSRAAQSALYRAAEGALPLRLGDLVPPGAADLASVRHFGRNSLPAFSLFEKRFCRPRGADAHVPAELWGFNFQPLAWLTGPGYFVARDDPARPEVRIDYHRVPPERPEGWPPIRPNDVGVSRFVYGFMIDTLRRVSEHASIGSAARNGRDLGSWFVLCREDQG